MSRILAVLLAAVTLACHAAPREKELVFIGSGHKNITAYWFNLKTGGMELIGTAANLPAPSFMAVSPNEKYLYAVSEGGRTNTSWVSGYKIDRVNGKLMLLNRQPTGGSGPCYVSSDHTGKTVMVANYNSGSVAAFPVASDGSLKSVSSFIQDKGSSVNPSRQEGPHAHCIDASPDNKYAFACDLGLDKVLTFKLNSGAAKLTANTPPFLSIEPGQGPRHLAFHPNKKFAYVISEMGSTITVLRYDKHHGKLEKLESQPLLSSASQQESWAAEVAVHPSGRFVYGSNRGDDTIAIFSCDPLTGLLTFSERVPAGVKIPRHFEIEPSGHYCLVAGQDSGNVVVFGLDNETGHLTPVASVDKLDRPMCVVALKP